MKLKAVQFDDDENPKMFTFDMTLDEAALLYRFVGSTQTKLVASHGQRWVEALNGLCAVSTALNNFYDDGVDDVAPRMDLVRRES